MVCGLTMSAPVTHMQWNLYVGGCKMGLLEVTSGRSLHILCKLTLTLNVIGISKLTILTNWVFLSRIETFVIMGQ